MAATVQIKRLAGVSPGQSGSTDVSTGATFRMKQADNPTSDTNNPIPAAGTLDTNASLSCWWATQLQCTVAPATGLSNLKWYNNNPAMATGTKLKGETATTYVVAPTTGLTFGGAGELTVANYSTVTTPVILGNAASGGVYTSAAKKTVTGSIGATTGYFGDIAVYQLQVASTAAAGVMTPTVTFSWDYDET